MIFGGKINTICSFREKITFRRPLSGLEKPPDLFSPPMFECGPAGCSRCCPITMFAVNLGRRACSFQATLVAAAAGRRFIDLSRRWLSHAHFNRRAATAAANSGGEGAAHGPFVYENKNQMRKFLFL